VNSGAQEENPEVNSGAQEENPGMNSGAKEENPGVNSGAQEGFVVPTLTSVFSTIHKSRL
jgi:hypothetical protein